MNTKWLPTTKEVFQAIRNQHRNDLVSHSSYTSMSDKRAMTSWGLVGSDLPLIKSDVNTDTGEGLFYLAVNLE